jgi:cystathionine gamma-lyase
MRDGTRVLRAGLPEPKQGEPFLPGPTFISTTHLAGDPASSRYKYGRYDNPTWSAWEGALSELEGGEAVSFASGMAAVHAAMGVVLEPGDAIVLPSDGYYSMRALAEERFGTLGVEVRQAPTAGDAQGRLLEGARLLWLETPANPGLDVCDIAALAAAAHQAGALVAVDNTSATPLGQRPLELGADFSVASDTKALCGHSDLVLGHVAATDPGWVERLRSWRLETGAIPGPMEVWLAHRSLATLDVRLERMCRNAQLLAELLAGRPEVVSVRYPGLATDPSHQLASRQMRRFGSVVSFDLGSREAAERFLSGCEIVLQATSFGGLHTTAERRARWGGDAVPEGFIRMSAGCEDGEDLLEDVAQALGAASGD